MWKPACKVVALDFLLPLIYNAIVRTEMALSREPRQCPLLSGIIHMFVYVYESMAGSASPLSIVFLIPGRLRRMCSALRLFCAGGAGGRGG
jgi:hypothetical protein